MLITVTKMPFWFWIVLLLFTLSEHAFAIGQTTRVSVGLGGANPNGSNILGYVHARAISANGRFVAFHSDADNLVTGDTNNDDDIFVYDRLTNKTTRVNVASNGDQTPVNSSSTICLGCSALGISSDGRFVAFDSKANNLVAGDSNSASDIFVHDLITKQTTRISLNSKGEQALGNSFSPSMSADGRFVVFESSADNLVAGDTNTMQDIFVHDRLTKQTKLVSVDSTGKQANFDSYGSAISADGHYIVFESSADNLVAGDTNVDNDVFVHNRLTSQITRVSVNSKGEQTNSIGIFPVPGVKISADGRYVVFHSLADNLVADDTNGAIDVFVRDLKTHQTTRVSVDSNNGQGNNFIFNNSSLNPDISANGRFVVFSSYSSLSANDTNNDTDAYIHDRLSHQTSLISVDVNGSSLAAGTGSEVGPSISADGRFVAFEGPASKIVAGDTFLGPSVLVRDRYLSVNNPSDLQIASTTKPASLAVNGLGNYTFTLSNNGSYATYAAITLLISNGNVESFAPSQGKCTGYATISFCHLGLVQPGGSVTLAISAKALRSPLRQQLTLWSGGRDDPNKINNYISLSTPVTP